jgi:hypothetical protein
VQILSGHCVGGLVGDNDGTITNSYATGNVSDSPLGNANGDYARHGAGGRNTRSHCGCLRRSSREDDDDDLFKTDT